LKDRRIESMELLPGSSFAALILSRKRLSMSVEGLTGARSRDYSKESFQGGG
jgi:hypothetical protein